MYISLSMIPKLKQYHSKNNFLLIFFTSGSLGSFLGSLVYNSFTSKHLKKIICNKTFYFFRHMEEIVSNMLGIFLIKIQKIPHHIQNQLNQMKILFVKELMNLIKDVWTP